MVKLVSITPNTESLIAFCARVSSSNQDNPDYAKLLRYLIDHQHWSPFELAHCVIEIETSRAIAQQILRHRSFSFQEFSQRYSSDTPNTEQYKARRQAEKNRQSSVDDCDKETSDWFDWAQGQVYGTCATLYRQALSRGIAREQARFLLPLSTGTRLYMAGTVRSWLHYVALRSQPDTQAEHRDIAIACRDILARELPTIAAACGWPTEKQNA